MNPYRFLRQLPDPDLGEVGEWVQSVDGLVGAHGAARARRLLLHVVGRADALGIDLPAMGVTDYVNTIPATDEPPTLATRTSSDGSAISSGGTRR